LVGVHVFHIAGRSDWSAAQRRGRYFSPGFDDRGRLDEHLSCVHEDQVDEVRRRVYADALVPLVLLEVDTDLLDSPVEEVGHGVRVLGPINTEAVVAVRDLPRASADEIAVSLARSTMKDFGGEVMLWGTLVMVFGVCVIGLAALGQVVADNPGGVVGGGVGLAIASALLVVWLRRQSSD
jgi:glutathione S-transferase